VVDLIQSQMSFTRIFCSEFKNRINFQIIRVFKKGTMELESEEIEKAVSKTRLGGLFPMRNCKREEHNCKDKTKNAF
jgi:hypothetical protein